LRVITGKVKGRKLKAPKGMNTRPTADRVKESIFNILGYIPENSIILDLFAGSGNVGIEFLSRGASKCYFIDNNQESIAVIKDNLTATRLSDNAYIIKNYVNQAITILGSKKIVFDYIFLDPPYENNLIYPTLEAIHDNELLSKSGVIIIEHEARTLLKNDFLDFSKYDSRKYGKTAVSFFRHKEV